MTRREQQTDAPEMLAPARAVAAREAARKGGRALQDALSPSTLPVPVPPSMQPGQPVPQLVSAETLDQLTRLMTERITQGDTELSRRIEQLGEAERVNAADLVTRQRALTQSRTHVRQHLASKAYRDIALGLDERVGLELRIARFLLDEE